MQMPIEITTRRWLLHTEDHLEDKAGVDTTETGGKTHRNAGNADLQII